MYFALYKVWFFFVCYRFLFVLLIGLCCLYVHASHCACTHVAFTKFHTYCNTGKLTLFFCNTGFHVVLNKNSTFKVHAIIGCERSDVNIFFMKIVLTYFDNMRCSDFLLSICMIKNLNLKCQNLYVFSLVVLMVK